MRAAILVPAYEASGTLAGVLRDLARCLPQRDEVPIIVIDDGSRDATAAIARDMGARVIRHPTNRGKGAAIVSGLREARRLGHEVAVTVDADGQHPAEEARRLLDAPFPAETLVLGARTFGELDAPRANRIGNQIANFWISLLTFRRFRDTQCGLRRYPVAATLALCARDPRYAFESEILLRADWSKIAVAEWPVTVVYPKGEAKTSHYRAVVDSTRITLRIISTVMCSSVLQPAARRAAAGEGRQTVPRTATGSLPPVWPSG